tara:strand:- start:168 stop:428 length:261 start_codon:yes stop_codon:yes gene_type:complete
MLDVPDETPTKQRRGIPNEKVRFVLRPVKEGFWVEKVAAATRISKTDVIAVITAYRKAAKRVVGKAVSSARAHEQLDVLLTKPSFV